jgi:(E)-4-hydroxy-3-methylbut-2-enyl-diphosphate synthase
MAATRTRDIEATLRQVRILENAGADLVRIAVDSKEDADCLAEIRAQTDARLSVDLQESYRLVTRVAPHVDKVRYNPGHLHHHEKTRPISEKVAFLAETAGEHGCAMRIGVNAGSIAPEYKERFGDDHVGAIVQCAVDHCALLDEVSFHNYVVSIKDSDPRLVIEANKRFAGERILADVPIDPLSSLAAHRKAGFQLCGRLDYVRVARKRVHQGFQAMTDEQAVTLLGGAQS